MPTGYTSQVQDGTVTEFSDFALSCARAFGACISMRDEPHDAQIPEEFKPSVYYSEAVDSAQAHLQHLLDMTDADKSAACEKANADALKNWHDGRAERATQEQRYKAMLDKVAAWTPPTDDHNGLKTFMKEQLTESINWDCRTSIPSEKPPEAQCPAEWYRDALSEANQALTRCSESLEEEVERARSRTQWLRDLRSSL